MQSTHAMKKINKFNVTHYYPICISISKNYLYNFNIMTHKFSIKWGVTKVVVVYRLWIISFFNYFLQITYQFVYTF